MYRIEGPEDGGKWPKGPNFLLIVALFGVTILVCLGVAFLVVPHMAAFLHHAVRPDHHPTS